MPLNLFGRGKAILFPVMALTALVCSVWANAQTQVPAPPAASTQAPGVPWGTLSAKQKQALAPLSAAWASLSEGQRRKWIAIAQNYAGLPETDQQKLHSRMVEWASLTPKDRELARLNFAQTQAVAKPERAANWEAYQALPPEEKKKLAASASTQPSGAALAPKPANRDKLTQVPVTRRTPETQKSAVQPKAPIHSSTLLPQKPSSAKDDNGTKATGQP